MSRRESRRPRNKRVAANALPVVRVTLPWHVLSDITTVHALHHAFMSFRSRSPFPSIALRVRSSLLTVALLVPFAAGCAPNTDSGKPRVVSVSKQINEFIYAIGAEDVLVGRDLTSIYPPQIKQVPSVGYHRALSAEGIISTKPTLLITDGNVGPEPVLEQVRKVGIPVVMLASGGIVDSA